MPLRMSKEKVKKVRARLTEEARAAREQAKEAARAAKQAEREAMRQLKLQAKAEAKAAKAKDRETQREAKRAAKAAEKAAARAEAEADRMEARAQKAAEKAGAATEKVRNLSAVGNALEKFNRDQHAKADAMLRDYARILGRPIRSARDVTEEDEERVAAYYRAQDEKLHRQRKMFGDRRSQSLGLGAAYPGGPVAAPFDFGANGVLGNLLAEFKK